MSFIPTWKHPLNFAPGLFEKETSERASTEDWNYRVLRRGFNHPPELHSNSDSGSEIVIYNHNIKQPAFRGISILAAAWEFCSKAAILYITSKDDYFGKSDNLLNSLQRVSFDAIDVKDTPAMWRAQFALKPVVICDRNLLEPLAGLIRAHRRWIGQLEAFLSTAEPDNSVTREDLKHMEYYEVIPTLKDLFVVSSIPTYTDERGLQMDTNDSALLVLLKEECLNTIGEQLGKEKFERSEVDDEVVWTRRTSLRDVMNVLIMYSFPDQRKWHPRQI